MAFPIPAHLPRKANPQDVSSHILNRVDSATNENLNSELVKSWLTELDETIQSTKKRLYERVESDRKAYDGQLTTSRSVQTRLKTLTSNVDTLHESLLSEESGLVPRLVTELKRHSTLAQEALDVKVQHTALASLLQCRTQHAALMGHVKSGNLPEAVQVSKSLEDLMSSSPPALRRSSVMSDFKRTLNTTKARVEELLSEAYSRSVVLTPKGITITSSVQVRESQFELPLSSILSAMSNHSLLDQLSTLRRNLTNHFLDNVLKQPFALAESSTIGFQHTLTLTPEPPNSPGSTRLNNVALVLDFLQTHLFPSLPSSQATSFKQSLCKPLTSSLLNHLLLPNLPPTFDTLPIFLKLVEQAVSFEDKYVIKLLQNDIHDRVIKTWGEGVSGHYERQRREHILEHCRSIVISPEAPSDTFRVEIDVLPDEFAPLEAPEPDSSTAAESGEAEAAWGFEEDTTLGESEGDSWGLDDDIPETDPIPEPQEDDTSAPKPPPADGTEEPDSEAAWDLNDGDNDATWDDDPWSNNPPDEPAIDVQHTPVKVASRLEKAASKSKKPMNGHHTESPTLHPPPSSALGKTPEKQEAPVQAGPPPKENYLVSGRTKLILRIVADVLTEGRQLQASRILPTVAGMSAPGTIIFQSASSCLDLYRALYPIKFSTTLSAPERAMRYSNDCLYLSEELDNMLHAGSYEDGVKQKLVDCKEHFRVLSESWLYDTVNVQKERINEALVEGTQGFTESADEERFDEYEEAINGALKTTKRVASSLKVVLSRTKYLIATGQIVEGVLTQMLSDILALPDIPEVESHKLAELCRIFHALEGLFMGEGEQGSLILSYVPSWLKFSYLSELLEASLADVTYLFEEGALVDFEIEEIIQLVRALFADTPLRTNTINKILQGHPVPNASG
ncbi:hypothetical protein BDN72DRAFT_889334 [Pluteus cervinus]|uniref:Uncharacterized protein n=1 Tax=Pluteus cervinus TaxID=181527 RepID=A0ACD3AJB3_9AGAR|nr:hypothetical protein BDN72DRAFT_889334 [Pluteus cervinus]